MEDDLVEVISQKFNGKEYFLCYTVSDDSFTYEIFAQIENPSNLLVAKNIETDEGEFYEIISDEYERIKIFALLQSSLPEN